MSDPCLSEFNARIERIEKARAKGYGFEAEDTIGRSSYTLYQRRTKRTLGYMRPLVLLLFCTAVCKAALMQQMGALAYDTHVAGLMANEGIVRLAGWLMQPDWFTTALAGGIDGLLAAFG